MISRDRKTQHPVEISAYLNNQGIAPSTEAHAGLDSFGTHFAQDSVPRFGSEVVCEGIRFIFPKRQLTGCDNIACESQQLELPIGLWRAMHVLGMSDWRAFEETVRLTFEDDERPACLGLTDAPSYGGLRYGELGGLRVKLVADDSLIPHAYLFGLPIPRDEYEMQTMVVAAGIWHQVVTLDNRAPVSGLILPENPSMHLFALTLVT